jgi:hypothetical protein
VSRRPLRLHVAARTVLVFVCGGRLKIALKCRAGALESAAEM